MLYYFPSVTEPTMKYNLKAAAFKKANGIKLGRYDRTVSYKYD